MIQGITVTLYERTQAGVDAFNDPVYTEAPVQVENVLVTPATPEDVVSDIQIYGKKSVYTLCLPKGDAHTWDDCRVDFFGESWHVFGFPETYIAENVPLLWNTKRRVERYG